MFLSYTKRNSNAFTFFMRLAFTDKNGKITISIGKTCKSISFQNRSCIFFYNDAFKPCIITTKFSLSNLIGSLELTIDKRSNPFYPLLIKNRKLVSSLIFYLINITISNSFLYIISCCNITFMENYFDPS